MFSLFLINKQREVKSSKYRFSKKKKKKKRGGGVGGLGGGETRLRLKAATNPPPLPPTNPSPPPPKGGNNAQTVGSNKKIKKIKKQRQERQQQNKTNKQTNKQKTSQTKGDNSAEVCSSGRDRLTCVRVHGQQSARRSGWVCSPPRTRRIRHTSCPCRRSLPKDQNVTQSCTHRDQCDTDISHAHIVPIVTHRH